MDRQPTPAAEAPIDIKCCRLISKNPISLENKVPSALPARVTKPEATRGNGRTAEKRAIVNGENSSIANALASCGQSMTNPPDIGALPLPNPRRHQRARGPKERSTNSTEDLLLKEVQPRLKSGIARNIPQIGTDDPGELLQDGMVIALHLLNSAERAGKKVSAGNISYYTLKALRVGRRSTGFRKTDPLHPAAQLSGRCHVHSLDERLTAPQPGDEPLTFADVLASKQDDPITKAGRRLEWSEVIQALGDMAKEVLNALVSGHELTRLVPRLGPQPVSPAKRQRRTGEAYSGTRGRRYSPPSPGTAAVAEQYCCDTGTIGLPAGAALRLTRKRAQRTHPSLQVREGFLLQ
jgi:hypothetical protein